MFEWKRLDEPEMVEREVSVLPPSPPRRRWTRWLLLLGCLLLLAGGALWWQIYRQQQRLHEDVQAFLREIDTAANLNRNDLLVRMLDPEAPLFWHSERVELLRPPRGYLRESLVRDAQFLDPTTLLVDLRLRYTPAEVAPTRTISSTLYIGMRLYEGEWRLAPIPETLWGAPILRRTPHFRILARKQDADVVHSLAQDVETLARALEQWGGTLSWPADEQPATIAIGTDSNGIRPLGFYGTPQEHLVMTSPRLLERYADRSPTFLAEELVLSWLLDWLIHDGGRQSPTRGYLAFYLPVRQAALLWVGEQSGRLADDPLVVAYRRQACRLAEEHTWPAIGTVPRPLLDRGQLPIPGIAPELDRQMAQNLVLLDLLMARGYRLKHLLPVAAMSRSWYDVAMQLEDLSPAVLDMEMTRWQSSRCGRWGQSTDAQ